MAARYEDYKRDYDAFLKEQRKKNEKRSICLLFSFILGAGYLVYLLYHFFVNGTIEALADSGWALLGTVIGQAMILPHTIAVLFAVILNGLGWGMKRKGMALAGAILYTAAIVAFPLYFPYVIVEMLLSYVGFALMNLDPGRKNGRRNVILVAVLLIVGIALAGVGWYFAREYIPEIDNTQAVESDTEKEQEPIAEASEKLDSSAVTTGESGTEPISLGAGDWIVGKDIPAGRYTVTTENDYCVFEAASDGEIVGHIYTTLSMGDGGYTGELYDGDAVHCSDPVTLTPYNP